MSLRRSRGTPVERRIGPVQPQLTASAVQITPTLRIRSMKMRLRSMRPWTRPTNSSYLDEDLLEPNEPALGQVAGEAADAAVGVGHARAGQGGEVLVDVVAQSSRGRGTRSSRPAPSAPAAMAGEVVGDARVFRQQRAQVAAARRDLDAHQLLDRLAVGEVVDQRRDVVQPVDVRESGCARCAPRTPSRSRGAGSRSGRRCAAPSRRRARR